MYVLAQMSVVVIVKLLIDKYSVIQYVLNEQLLQFILLFLLVDLIPLMKILFVTSIFDLQGAILIKFYFVKNEMEMIKFGMFIVRTCMSILF